MPNLEGMAVTLGYVANNTFGPRPVAGIRLCLLRTLAREPRTLEDAMVGDGAAIHMAFDRDPYSASRARRTVQDCLDGTTPVETVSNAGLLTSELVTNVVIHTLTSGELVAYCDRLRKLVRIEVRDNSPVLPQMQDDSTDASVGGVGLRLVDKVASSWGTTATATGKTVWFELSW